MAKKLNEQFLFEKQIRFLKHSSPGLSHFHSSPHPLFDPLPYTSSPIPCLINVCLSDHRAFCSPISQDTSIRVLYLAVLIQCLQQSPSCNSAVLRRLKAEAYDEGSPLTILPVDKIEPQFRKYYEDAQLRKLVVEFFHLVPSKKGPNRVLRFIETHSILDLIFRLLFTRIAHQASRKPLFQQMKTAQLIDVLFQYFQIPVHIFDNRLILPEGYSIAEDAYFTYFLYPIQLTYQHIDTMADEQAEESDMEIESSFLSQSPFKDHSKIQVLTNTRSEIDNCWADEYTFSQDRGEIKRSGSSNHRVEPEGKFGLTSSQSGGNMGDNILIKKQPTKEEQKNTVRFLGSQAYIPVSHNGTRMTNFRVEKKVESIEKHIRTGGLVHIPLQGPLTFSNPPQKSKEVNHSFQGRMSLPGISGISKPETADSITKTSRLNVVRYESASKYQSLNDSGISVIKTSRLREGESITTPFVRRDSERGLLSYRPQITVRKI